MYVVLPLKQNRSHTFVCNHCSADLLLAAVIAVPSIVGARIGVRLAEKMSGELLALIFNGMSVILIPTHVFVQEYRKKNPRDHVEPVAPLSFERARSALVDPMMYQHALYGVVSGILSALMGVGGAPLTMSYLTLQTTLPHHLVQVTVLLHIENKNETCISCTSPKHVTVLLSCACTTLNPLHLSHHLSICHLIRSINLSFP